ncbi:PEP-CTERM sorting domain-containing protein [Caldimonas brevitalea]|uniref:Ice-binding protein C-terminal domain-containing protein n=1 Tax=Caldimonas brevitalea TaxID=413882 RepID=A0A0G3BJM3_9BURK|nr:PEP-CTERM sorting domain-containing protein [Caldimonas brevitalea]AKJ27581.1 hypothetical protein AAW51_0890 [Caldimonas brevitalea]
MRPLAIACLLSAFGATTAHAGVALQPVEVSTSAGWVFDVEHLIDQTGLNTTYVSGVDDFDAFVSTKPSAVHCFGDCVWATQNTHSATLDFDLGTLASVESLALWNLGADDPSSLKTFELVLSRDAGFSDATSVGTFTAANDLGDSFTTFVQVFDFEPTFAAYARINVIESWSPDSFGVGFNEVVFNATPVPEPSTFALTGTALLLGAVVRRKYGKGQRRTLPAAA